MEVESACHSNNNNNNNNNNQHLSVEHEREQALTRSPKSPGKKQQAARKWTNAQPHQICGFSQGKPSGKKPPATSPTSSHPSKGKKKHSRVRWSAALHYKFLAAVNKLGAKAVPSLILREMGNPDLTREQIASHLQKYRLCLLEDKPKFVFKDETQLWNTHHSSHSGNNSGNDTDDNDKDNDGSGNRHSQSPSNVRDNEGSSSSSSNNIKRIINDNDCEEFEQPASFAQGGGSAKSKTSLPVLEEGISTVDSHKKQSPLTIRDLTTDFPAFVYNQAKTTPPPITSMGSGSPAGALPFVPPYPFYYPTVSLDFPLHPSATSPTPNGFYNNQPNRLAFPVLPERPFYLPSFYYPNINNFNAIGGVNLANNQSLGGAFQQPSGQFINANTNRENSVSDRSVDSKSPNEMETSSSITSVSSSK